MKFKKLFILTLGTCFLQISLGQKDHFEKGLLAISEDSLESAIQLFQEDIQLSPSFESYYNLGVLYEQFDNYPYAIWALESSLKLQPFSTKASNKLQNIYNKEFKVDWSHPYSFGTKLQFFIGAKIWFTLALICSMISGWILYYLFKKKTPILGYSLISLIISTLLFAYNGYQAEKKPSQNNFIIFHETPKTYITPNGIEYPTEINLGKRHSIVLQSEEWIQFISEDNRPLWVEEKYALIY